MQVAAAEQHILEATAANVGGDDGGSHGGASRLDLNGTGDSNDDELHTTWQQVSHSKPCHLLRGLVVGGACCTRAASQCCDSSLWPSQKIVEAQAELAEVQKSLADKKVRTAFLAHRSRAAPHCASAVVVVCRWCVMCRALLSVLLVRLLVCDVVVVAMAWLPLVL